jgi:hypothetical protein
MPPAPSYEELVSSYKGLVEQLMSIQERCNELLVNQALLKTALRTLLDATPDERDQAAAVAEMLVKGIQ